MTSVAATSRARASLRNPQPATNNHCEATLAWHVSDGRYGDIVLEDLNIMGVASFDGNVWDNPDNFELGLFIDDRADAQQHRALVAIMTGKAGGFMADFSARIATDRSIESAPISFEIADDLAYWRAHIPGRIEAEGEALGGHSTPPGKRVQLLNPPGSEVGPGGPATWATATRNNVDAFGYNWDWSGKSSKHIPIDCVGP